MNPNILREALLVATHDPRPDAPELPPAHVEEWAGRRVVVIAEPGTARFADLRALALTGTEQDLAALTRDDIRSMARLEPAPVIVSVDTMRRLCEPDPLLAPVSPAALAAIVRHLWPENADDR